MSNTESFPDRERVLAILNAAGGRTRVARELGLTPQAIHAWVVAGKIPLAQAFVVSGMTKGKYAPWEVNDLIPERFTRRK